MLHVAAGGPDVGRPPAPGRQGVVAVATPPAHRAPGRRPSRPCGNDYGVSLDSGALDDGGAQAEGGLEYTLLHAAARLSPVVFSWSKNKRYAGRAAAARCRLLPSGQPTQTPEEPVNINGCCPVWLVKMGSVDDWRYILSRAPEGRGACRGQPAKITSQGLMARRRGATFAGAQHVSA